MIRFAVMIALCAVCPPAFGADKTKKETDCTYQADVVRAVQTARLEGVKEKNIAQEITKTDPEWPEAYNNVVPIVSGWIYGEKLRDLKKNDYAAHWEEACLAAK